MLHGSELTKQIKDINKKNTALAYVGLMLLNPRHVRLNGYERHSLKN